MQLTLRNLRHPSDYDALSAIHRAQLERITVMYDGGLASGRERLANDGSETSFVGFLDLWDLVEGDDLRYEFWHYLTDSGTIFVAGTTEVVAEVGQGYLCSIDDHAFMRAFRDAVEASMTSFPERQNTPPEVRIPATPS